MAARGSVRLGPEQVSRLFGQVTLLFWRAFGRAPTADETSAVRTAFQQVYARQQSAYDAWKAVLYAVFSSLEFWNP